MILEEQGPQGDTGATGAQGAKGDTGAQVTTRQTKVFLVKMRIMLRLSEVITITHKLEKTRGCG